MQDPIRLAHRLGDVALSRPSAFTFPNVLTVARLILAPCFLYLVLRWLTHGDENAHLLASACFVAIALSDLFDGYLARRLNQYTALGSVLDPAADFLFVLVSFIVLGVYGLLPMWLVIIAASKCVLLAGGWILRYAVLSILRLKPTLLGKFTSCMQFVCVGLALIESPQWLNWLVWGVTGVGAVVSLADYLLAGVAQGAENPVIAPDESPNVVLLATTARPRETQGTAHD